MLIDSFLPEGFTHLAVDSIFMMPQLGVLSTVHPQAATQVFERDCLIHLGTCIAPVGPAKPGKTILTLDIDLPTGTEHMEMRLGEITKTIEPERLLTCAQAGRMLALKERQVREAIWRGNIPAIKIGRHVRIPLRALKRLVRGRRRKTR